MAFRLGEKEKGDFPGRGSGCTISVEIGTWNSKGLHLDLLGSQLVNKISIKGNLYSNSPIIKIKNSDPFSVSIKQSLHGIYFMVLIFPSVKGAKLLTYI